MSSTAPTSRVVKVKTGKTGETGKTAFQGGGDVSKTGLPTGLKPAWVLSFTSFTSYTTFTSFTIIRGCHIPMMIDPVTPISGTIPTGNHIQCWRCGHA